MNVLKGVYLLDGPLCLQSRLTLADNIADKFMEYRLSAYPIVKHSYRKTDKLLETDKLLKDSEAWEYAGSEITIPNAEVERQLKELAQGRQIND
jgi:hypothetical protein